MPDPHYIFKTAQDQAEFERLQLIEKVFDPQTRSRLENLGLRSGSRCLELGPGGGSILRWMCEKAGDAGRVTAVEMNARFVRQIQSPNLSLIESDIAAAALPESSFDFIHARYVFLHIRDYKPVFEKLVRCLKPGGWILLEDPDFGSAKVFTESPAFSKSFYRIRDAIRVLFDAMGLDPRFGGKLEPLFRKSGLEEVGSYKNEEKATGGSQIAEMMKRSALHLQKPYLETEACDAADIENYCRLAEDPQSSAIYYSSVSVWGRKPV